MRSEAAECSSSVQLDVLVEDEDTLLVKTCKFSGDIPRSLAFRADDWLNTIDAAGEGSCTLLQFTREPLGSAPPKNDEMGGRRVCARSRRFIMVTSVWLFEPLLLQEQTVETGLSSNSRMRL